MAEKYLRSVGSYVRFRHHKRRKPQRVRGYTQKYDKPRGKIGKLVERSDQNTIWLKDANGWFVGRANAKGETTAKKVAMAGKDGTSAVGERGRYGRIYGRTKG